MAIDITTGTFWGTGKVIAMMICEPVDLPKSTKPDGRGVQSGLEQDNSVLFFLSQRGVSSCARGIPFDLTILMI